MAMAALREASRRLASTRNPVIASTAARPLLLTHSRGVTHHTQALHRRLVTICNGRQPSGSFRALWTSIGSSATIVTDKMTSRSKGFGFVKFASEEEANKAREDMNGKVLNGRVIYVDIAKTKQDRAVGVVPIARGPAKPIDDS